MARSTAIVVLLAVSGAQALSACVPQGESGGNLVGRYAVHGVLLENSCGQGLPASGSFDFQVEIREADGVGSWAQNKSARNSGSLSDEGAFRFSASQTTVVKPAMLVQPEPSDFLGSDPDRDLRQQRACAVTTKETITGNLQRWRKADGSITESSLRSDAGSDDDLSANHLIEVAPSSGSDCNSVLVAFGGTYNALPCEARYQLRGVLDTTGSVRAGAAAPKAGSGGKAGNSAGVGGGS
jgi:hypothetical protein